MHYWIAVAAGGSLGALLRAVVARYLVTSSSGFPYATLAVNLAGCLLVGLACQWLLNAPHATRGLVIVGALGALTTFSTFGLDTIRMLEQEHYMQAASYVLISNIGGIGLVALGLRLGKVPV